MKPKPHVGQWIDVDGKPYHVLADPNMTPELKDALAEMIRCTLKALEDGTLPKRKREKMQGKRHDMIPGDETLAPGEYGKLYSDGEWYARAPQEGDFYAGMGRLSAHGVIEHEDGTITVSPSILITGHHDKQWHGYLERGIWRKV